MANALDSKQTTALDTKTASTAIERPDWLPKGDTRGTEHITNDDLQMPRLRLAQQMSPEIDSGNAAYIEGLRNGEMFIDLTKTIIGRGPIDFTVVRADPPRYIEFIPREQGGGIKDMNVAANDPRTQFTKDATGKSVPPIATKFYDFVIMMVPSRELLVLSLKSSGLKTARQLNGLMKVRNAPLFAGRYTLSTASAKNAKGTFAVFNVTNSKENGGWLTKDEYQFAEQVFEGVKGREIKIDREPGEDDVDFPADHADPPAPSEM